MKKSTLPALLIIIALLVTGACSSNAWDDLPRPIATFISEYFPGQGIKSYSEVGDSECVVVNNGATIMFDKNYEWITADGNGSPLPATFINDKMPPALFQYLQTTSQLNEVYKVERTSLTYVLTLQNTYVTYNVETQAITYPSVDA